jgi:hypothetical protein
MEIIVSSLFVAAITEGLGRHNYYVTPEEKVDIFVPCQNLNGTDAATIR